MTSRERLYALEQIGIKLGLEQIRGLVERLGHPDRAFTSIIVAGTNGKGSVTAMLERALRAAGYRTGRYTSPHLVRLEERFAIDGEDVSSADLDASADRVLAAGEHLPAPPSFFEATTAMALDLFRNAAIDVAVLEVGLGGRLDATNVVDVIAVAITAIDFDHEQFLGNTIEAIAREKAGVIKKGSVVVLSTNPAAVDAVVAEVAASVGARLVRAESGVQHTVTMANGRAMMKLQTPHASYDALALSLSGRHQVQNAITAVRLLEEIDATRRLTIPSVAIAAGVETATWPGRLELIPADGFDVLIDGAHNPAGARALSAYLAETYGRRLPMVVAAMRDKNIDALLTALSASASHFVFTAPSSARAAAPFDLAAAAARVAPSIPVSTAERPTEALHLASSLGSPVVVAGSLYLAGEIRAEIA